MTFPWLLLGQLAALSAAEGLRLRTAGLGGRAAMLIALAELVVVGAGIAAVLAARRRRIVRTLADTGAAAAVAGNLLLSPVDGRAGFRSRRVRTVGVIMRVEQDRILTAARAAKNSVVAGREQPFGSLAVVELTPTLAGVLPATMVTLRDTRGWQLQIRVPSVGQRDQFAAFRAVLASRARIAQTEVPAWTPLLAWCLPAAMVLPLLVGSTGFGGLLPSTVNDRITAGYNTFNGPDHRALQHGQPWGQRCVAVELMPMQPTADLLIQAQQVTAEARADRLNVTVVDPAAPYTPPVAGSRPPVIVPIYSHLEPAPLSPSGSPLREVIGWDASRAGSHDRLTHLKQDLYLSSLNGDSVLTRAALRALVARTAGVAPNSTAPGTGIAAHLEDSADGFSAQDLTVMRSFSGC